MQNLFLIIFLLILSACSTGESNVVTATKLLDNVNIEKISVAQTVYSSYLPYYSNIFKNDTIGNVVAITIKNNNPDHYINIMLESEIEDFSYKTVSQCYINQGETKTLYATPLIKKSAIESLNELTNVPISITLKINQSDTVFYPFFQETYNINLTSKNMAIFQLLVNSDTLDITNYIVMWITPNSSIIDSTILPEAAKNCKYNMLFGYQNISDQSNENISLDDLVREQIKAIYITLQNMDIHYINNTIGFGGNQKIKFPSEVLKTKSANCIEGTLLFATIIEAIGINPIIIIEQDHAFVGWETWDDSKKYEFLETTMTWNKTEKISFNDAEITGINEFNQNTINNNFANGTSKFINVKEIRQNQNIFPLPLQKKINN